MACANEWTVVHVCSNVFDAKAAHVLTTLGYCA
jgi:hypothetical protein